jgi:SAM-dependent methyltransferase
VKLLSDCHRILKPDGLLVVSVPDADYFLSVHDRDTPENAVVLFGEPIHDKWQPNFMSYALFHRDHRQVLTGGSLRCLLIQAGFKTIWRLGRFGHVPQSSELKEIEKIMNRRQFSLEMCAIKSSAP